MEFGGCNNILTDNLVDEGQKLGILISGGPHEYNFTGFNTIQYANTWGIQIQGDDKGSRYHYFYNNTFQYTYKNHPQAWYPNQGHGFRVNGNCQYITLESNEIKNNEGVGIQFTSAGSLDQFSFINNSISGNAGKSITGDPGGDNLEWVNNTVSGNGQNNHLTSRGFENEKPTASFNCTTTVAVGDEITFTNTSSDSDGSIGHVLWDFDDGIPSTKLNPAYVYTKQGTYRVTFVVWDNLGRGARTERMITIFDPNSITVEDFETGDFSGLDWQFSGEANWNITSNQAVSGTYSTQAGSINHGESSTLIVTYLCGDGDISFYRKTSSESGFDHLKFYVDGVKKDSWSGKKDWAEVSFPVTAGIRTFEWTYSKDGSGSRGDDTAWIDDITFPRPLVKSKDTQALD